MLTCRGYKKGGVCCKSPIVLDNGYCRVHQDQAREEEILEELVCWSRDRLEAVITAHGGSEGLDLAGIDLSNLSRRLLRVSPSSRICAGNNLLDGLHQSLFHLA